MLAILIDYKWALAIAGEVLFFVFAFGLFASRYWLKRPKLGYIFVPLLILNELFLGLLAVLDYQSTGEISSFTIVTVLVYLYLIFFGKHDLAKLDRYFNAKFSGETQQKPTTITRKTVQMSKLYGRAHARKERLGWYEHLAIFLIAQIIFVCIAGFSGWSAFDGNNITHWMFSVYGDERINNANHVWGIILIIDFIISFSYTLWPQKQPTSKPTLD